LQSLSHCELLTDEGIRQLGGSACATESLSVLELDNCPLITDASLDHLMGCQNLQRIELYDCQLITKAGIRRLRVWRSSIRLVHLLMQGLLRPTVALSMQKPWPITGVMPNQYFMVADI
jgi:hypothetical protein